MTETLTQFEGMDVRRASIEIPNAAGGLRDAMKIDPQEFHQGEEIYIVLKCVVQKVRFEPIDKADPSGDQNRVHVFNAEEATFADAELVADHVAAQTERIARAKEQAEGISRLPTDDEREALGEDHAEGKHAAGLVPGCPDCEEEAAAAAEEAGDPAPIAGRIGPDPDDEEATS
jgi:hypothetical protein